MPYFTGKVSGVVFSKKEQGFYILKMILDEDKDVETGWYYESLTSVKGYVPGIAVSPGVWFGFEAEWVTDPKYGKQLSITRAPLFRGKLDSSMVVRMLTEDGVSSIMANRLGTTFGSDLSDALQDAERVRQSLTISSFEAEFLTNKWKTILRRFRIFEILGDLDIPRHKVTEIWGHFGEKTEEVLTEKPWLLVEIEDIPFSVMDDLARRNSLDLSCKLRRKSAVVYATRKHRRQGDVYLTTVDLLSGIRSILPDVPQAEIIEAVRDAVSDNYITIDGSTLPGTNAVYLKWFFEMEDICSQALTQRLRVPVSKHRFDSLSHVGERTSAEVDAGSPVDRVVQVAVDECAESMGFVLSEQQREAMLHALLNPISIITGLPGTGKSTSLQVLVEVLRRSNESVLLMAPTGIAAKRLGSVCRSPAFTIHRALGAVSVEAGKDRESTYEGVVGSTTSDKSVKGEKESWTHGPSNPHHAGFIIVDESSMVDQHLLFRILKGTLPHSRLVFVGDAAQLPSVGPGNVLRDMLSSGAFPHTHLTQVFRQAETSGIVRAAHRVFSGLVPEMDIMSDFSLIPTTSDEQTLDVILKLVRKFYEKSSSWESEDSSPSTFQVLSPRHGGPIGVTSLNASIREVLNPKRDGVKEVRAGASYIREGDRVMITKNNYDKEVYNGDIGKITYISDVSPKTISVKVHDPVAPRVIDFRVGEAGMLRLAYACTVHKYQGLEVDVVIMPVTPSFGRQLQRNLFYTAITRAKQKVILVGSASAVAEAVRNDKEDARLTLLSHRVKQELQSFAEQEECAV